MRGQPLQLSDHFTYKNLLRFSLSPIAAMVFTSLYGIVDGFFVSNYVGATPFASLNLVFPYIMLIAGIGFMFGSGGSALVAQHLGMQEKEKANRYFSLIVYTTALCGMTLGGISFLFAPQIALAMGATEAMLPHCVTYLRINLFGMVFFMLQQQFQTFLITAEKPKLGFRVTLIAGCMNMFLDWLLVGTLRLGLAGAAWATISSQCIGGMIPLWLFIRRKDWIISLGKTSFEIKVLLKAAGNGISEFLSNVSSSIVGFLMNLQLLRYAGENGISAYGVMMYVSFIFVAIYLGYTMGTSPIVSYNDGARNTDELKSLYKKSLRLIFITNIAMFLLAEATAAPLSLLFVGYNAELYALTERGMRLLSLCFLVMGFNIFASAFFTALNNGRVSAILSVSRMFVIQLIAIYLLPLIWDIDGLWLVAAAVDGIGLIMTIFYLRRYGKKYGYR